MIFLKGDKFQIIMRKALAELCKGAWDIELIISELYNV